MNVSSHVSSNVSSSEGATSYSSVACADSNTSTPTEYTRLLPKPISGTNGDDFPWNDEPDKDTSELLHGKRILTEFWELFKGSVPVILAYMLQMSLQTVPVIIVGHLSSMYLAASAFSLMFALVTGWMIALGGTTAMDTLASSTFTGSENKHDLGILLQRAFLVLGAFFVPVAVIWACSEHIFLALGQDPELSSLSSKFLTALIPGGLGYIYFETMKKYLQAQGKKMYCTALYNR
jgi:MATE family multidrug resistance protein